MANSTILQLTPVFAIDGSEQVPMVKELSGEQTTVRVASSLLGSGPSSSSQSANKVYAGPTSGSAAAPSFRALVSADIPQNLTLAGLTVSGTATVGTLTQTGTISANLIMAGPTTGAAAAPTYRALVSADIPQNLSIATLTTSGAATIGGAASVTGTATVGGLTTSGTVSGATVTGGAVNGTTGSFTTLAAGSASISGTCTATTFSGSGASLTSVPYASLSGTGAANSVLFNSALNTPSAISSAASSVLITNGSNVPSFSSTLPAITFATGTTSIAPTTYVAGTNLATATAGVTEYDGKAMYFTPVATNRGVKQTVHFLSLSADQTGTNGTGAQTLFPGGGATTITLPGSTTYFFEGLYVIRNAGGNSRALQLQFGGTATFSSLQYVAMTDNGTVETLQAPSMTLSVTASATAVTAAVAAVTHNTIMVRGVLRVNAGGTLIPQFSYSNTPGASPTIFANSYFLCYAVGSNTVLNVGQWS